nr:MAG: terminase large subunit [Caudoviricetes sp.]
MDINSYLPRDVFLPLHKRDARWAVVVAHRRCGKTVAMCADLLIGALECALPSPQFAYLAPFRDQAKKVAWSYLKDLSRPLWAKPPNESELHITINNGHGNQSRIYVAGADNPDALRGMYFDGVVLDEVGMIRPSAWYSVLRPALSDRMGWAIFAGTPAGKNFFWQMREEARLNPKTHLLLELPASKTNILHPDELRDARAQMTEESYLTEYEISFDAAIPGAYYAKALGEAYSAGRVGAFGVDKGFPVDLAADLGYTDSCSWWGWQTTPDGYRVVDFYEADGQAIGHYIDWIKSRPYQVGNVFLPHDAKAKSLQTGMSIMEQFLAAGITPRIVPEMSLQDGIEAARLVLPKCWFDEGATYDGIEHLRGYMREWDERTQMYRSRPKHDQHSHAADAFRYMALSTKKVSGVSSGFEVKKKVSAGASYSFSLDDVWDCAPQAINRIG